MRVWKNAAFAAAALLATLAPVRAATWTIDGSHSNVSFTVKHLMISNVRGEFGKVSGTVEFDGKDVSAAKVDATIDAATIDTREPKRDEHVRSADFLDTANHPTITFKSKKATPAGAGRFTLVGDLTIRGTTKEITLEVEGPTPEIKDPWGNTRVGVSASGKFNRKDFGVNWSKTMDAGGLVVGDEIKVAIDLELVRKAEGAKPAEGKAEQAKPAAK